jgi:hypothetical protein
MVSFLSAGEVHAERGRQGVNIARHGREYLLGSREFGYLAVGFGCYA